MEMMSASGSVRKTSHGRKKIEIKKIEKQSSRQVTFSKRRVGLFKKASELCILSGAHVAIVVQSNGKRVFSFGHPTADAVIDRFLSGENDVVWDNRSPPVVANMEEYNKHYADVSKELDFEKKRRVSGGGAAAAGKWWLDGVDGKGVEELEQYVAALDELSKKLIGKADDFRVMQGSNSLLPPLPAALMAAPPMMLNDTSAFVNQNFHNQAWSGYDFGQGHI